MLVESSKLSIQNSYKAAGLSMFLLSVGLLLARLFVSVAAPLFVPHFSENGLRVFIDTLFTVLAQVLLCLMLVFLVYKVRGKNSTRQVLELSNIKKTNLRNVLLAVPIGLLGIFVTMGVSMLSMILINLLGYNRASGVGGLPTQFSMGFFILQLVLIAVLPAICEEFAIRGGLFNTLYSTTYSKNKKAKFYVLMALAFGLFHQNITQFFYTAFFGFIIAYVVVKTKSIFPAIIIHFVNNAASVFISHAAMYNFRFFGQINNSINYGLRNNLIGVILIYVAIVLVFTLLLKLLKTPLQKEQPILINNATFKPTLNDNAFFIGAIVVSGSFTLFTFIWGLMY